MGARARRAAPPSSSTGDAGRRSRLVDPELQGGRAGRRHRRAASRSGRASHPDGTEVDPAAWWDALPAALADAGGLADVAAIGSPASSTAWWPSTPTAASSALPCSGTTPVSARLPRDLIDEVGAAEYVRRTGVVPVASFTVDQAALAARRRTGQRRPGRRRRAAARLAHLAAARLRPGRRERAGPGARASSPPTVPMPAAPATGRPPPASTTASCSCRALGHDAVLPRVLGPGERRARCARWRRTRRVPAPATTPRRRSGPGRRGRRRRRVDRHQRHGLRRHRDARSSDATGTVAGFADATGGILPLIAHAQRRPGPRRHRRPARRWTTTSSARSRSRPSPAPSGAGAAALLRGRAHAQPARRHRVALRADPGHHHPAEPRPGRDRGHALRARRRAGCHARAGRRRPTASC